MFKKKGLKIIAILIIVCCICGCGSHDTSQLMKVDDKVNAEMSRKDIITDLGNEYTLNSEIKDLPNIENEIREITEDNSNWKEEYKKVILNINDYSDFIDETAFFYLEDFDFDGIPELVFSIMYGARGFLDDILVFSMKDGACQYVQLDQSSSLGLCNTPEQFRNTDTYEKEWLINFFQDGFSEGSSLDIQRLFFDRQQNKCWTETIIQTGVYQYPADREMTVDETILLDYYRTYFKALTTKELHRIDVTETELQELLVISQVDFSTHLLTEQEIVEFLDVYFE